MEQDSERDFFAEGIEAAQQGDSDAPPISVSAFGSEAEFEWIDGYESAMDMGGID